MEADRMKTADALMVIYYVVLSGVLVFTLGYFAGLASRQEEAIMTLPRLRYCGQLQSYQ